MKSLVHTEELCSRSVPLAHAPGAKPLVCVGLKGEGEKDVKAKIAMLLVFSEEKDPVFFPSKKLLVISFTSTATVY